MDSGQPIQLVGMALLRGLLDESTLRNALATEQDLLEALKAQGSLDAEDLRDLAKLVNAESQGQLSASEEGDPPTHPFRSATGKDPWDSLPSADDERDGTDYQVLRVLTLSGWKHYQNLRFVAEGGMGRVFKAFDPSLKRMVALKFLRREEPELLTRFVLEAQHQAKVEHPNICRVFEVGNWRGQSYIAMQFLKGETLEVAAPGLSLIEKVKVMEVVAEAVHAAHRQGLIHRDIKPANIILEAEERGPKPTILDFGLAKGLEATGLTVQGLVIGTTHYMAPEQARGDHNKVGRRTDVYGLGATLYKVLTGQVSFAGTEGVDVIRRTLEEDLPSLRLLVPELPEDLDTIVRKCMEKDPIRRYESALAVAEDLRRWREGEPILARKPTLRYRGAKWARKHRMVVMVMVTALMALTILGGFTVWAEITAAARTRYAQDFGQEAERIEALSRFIALSPPHDVGPERERLQQRMGALEAKAVRAGHLAEGPAQYALGRALLSLNRSQEAMKCFEKSTSAGFTSPDLAYSQAKALILLYQTAQDGIRTLQDPATRLAQWNKLKEQYQGRILRLLAQAEGQTLEPQALQMGRLALAEGRFEEVRHLLKTVGHETPWLVEIPLLRAEGLLGEAMGNLSLDRSIQSLEAALRELGTAKVPSEVRLMERQSVILDCLVERRFLKGESPHAETSALESLSRRWAILEPEATGPLLCRLQGAASRFHWQAREGKGLGRETVPLERELHALLARSPSKTRILGLLVRLLNDRWRWASVKSNREYRVEVEGILPLVEATLVDNPLDENLIKFYGDICSDLCLYYRSARLGTGPMVGILDRLEDAARSFPEVDAYTGAISVLGVELAEFKRIEGEDPTPYAERAMTAALVFQRHRPSYYAGFRSEANAALVLGASALYSGKGDALPYLQRASVATEKALLLNPSSRLDLLSRAIICWMEAELALRKGEVPLKALAKGRRALARVGQGWYWYVDYLEGMMDLVQAEWEGRHGGRFSVLEAVQKHLRGAWVKEAEMESSLLRIRLLRLRGKTSPRHLREAKECLQALFKRFPRLPEALEEARLLGAKG